MLCSHIAHTIGLSKGHHSEKADCIEGESTTCAWIGLIRFRFPLALTQDVAHDDGLAGCTVTPVSTSVGLGQFNALDAHPGSAVSGSLPSDARSLSEVPGEMQPGLGRSLTAGHFR